MSDDVIKLRPFKFKQTVETEFFQQDNTINKAFATADLARSGLSADDLMVEVPAMLRLPRHATAGYVIPYYDVNGRPLIDSGNNLIMWRTRLKVPDFSRGSRYTQPTGEQLAAHGLPPFLPYIHPETMKLPGEVIYCAEGEKKCAGIIKHLGLPAFGVGGCQMWRNPDGSATLHPWIKELLRKRDARTVCIIPDGDLFRYDICRAYGAFAHQLRAEGYDVTILNPSGKIDDLLVEWGPDCRSNFANLPTVSPDELVQSPASLSRTYNLAFKQNDKGVITVYQHTSNVMLLLENHSAFPKIWRNLDTNRVMVGDEVAQPDLTEMELANHFQHQFGFDRVTHHQLHSCIQSLSKKNARSPMLDHVRGTTWDGVERLDTWMVRCWGIEDTPFTREVSAKWLVSACARMEKPGTKVDWMLIVVGPQGTGKTSMPSIVFKGNSLTLYGEANDKDFHMKIHSALVIGFDELDSFGKKETSFLKAMITTAQDHFRPPYGSSVEVFERRSVLYGCGNRHDFLVHDPSGYRRYAILEVNKLLNFAALEAEVDQLWAEAWERYQRGEKFWEVANASEQAAKYVIPNIMEEKVQAWLDNQLRSKIGGRVHDGVLYFTMSEIADLLNINARNPYESREVAAILKALGAQQRNIRLPGADTPRRMYAYSPPEPTP